MTKTLLAFFLLLLPCGLTRPAHAAPSFDSTSITAAAQDSTGAVWAMQTNQGPGKISRWQNGAWTDQTIPSTAGFTLKALTRGDDGSVYSLWQEYRDQAPAGQAAADQCLVTVHRGPAFRILALFDGLAAQNFNGNNQPALFAGAAGDVWIAGYQPFFWHITPRGTVQSYPLKPEQCFGGRLPPNYRPPAYESLVDDMGRRWLWQDGPRRFEEGSGLRGILIWDGKTLAYHPTLAGVPDEPISTVAPLDKDHFLLTAQDNGPSLHPKIRSILYRVDTRTLAVTPEPLPHSGTFSDIVQVFHANNDWYAVDQCFSRQKGPETALWRRYAGKWREEVENLEESGSDRTPDTTHPWLQEPRGTWLGAGGGAWWLPRGNTPPFKAGWRRGVPATVISRLFALPDGRVLVSGEGGTAEISAAPLPVQPLPPRLSADGLGAPTGLEPLAADPRRHLWGIRRVFAHPLMLAEWDGVRWTLHLPPPSIIGVNDLYACDTQGRVWLTTHNWHPPAQPNPVDGRAVYDPIHDTWTSYATVPEALQATAALPGMAFLPLRSRFPSPLPSFSDGRVTYSETMGSTTVFLGDGKAWRHWETYDIVPGIMNADYLAVPHFNREGHLEFAVNSKEYAWTPATGWQQEGEDRGTQYRNPVPPGGPAGLWGIPAVDNLGVKWFEWQGAVYAAGYGLWAKQPELSALGSPFARGFGIEDVLRDPAGRFFFLSRPAGRSEQIVWSPPPVPKPSVSVTPLSEDSVSVRFTSALPGPHWFLWRVNGGAWGAPTTARTLALTALPRGDYRLEVQALDSRLQVSPAAVAVWSVRVDPQTQIARWVSALSAGPDDAREIAVAGLVKQPAAALPALKAARPAASDLGKWWIDAAIQQITDAAKITAGETPQIAN